MQVVFVCCAVLILVLVLPIFLRAKISFSLLPLGGAFGFYVLGIKVLYYNYKIEHNQIILQNEKKTVCKPLEVDKKRLAFAQEFFAQVKRKILVKNLFVFYNLGLGDAFASAMAGGALNSTILGALTALKSYRPTASLGVQDGISYNREVFEIALSTKISISLFDVVYSFVVAVMLTSRRAAN